MEYWLPVAWFGVIGFGVLMYVLLDGFVLGLGILAPFARDEHELDHMMNTAAPIWDGNETWLVLGGAGLLAAFPKAYALILSTLYLPVLMMLIALIFRGVAFEFRFKATRGKPFWGAAFALGSMVVAFAQGVMLGAIVEGIPRPAAAAVHLPAAFAWFSPFSMLTGVALVFIFCCSSCALAASENCCFNCWRRPMNCSEERASCSREPAWRFAGRARK